MNLDSASGPKACATPGSSRGHRSEWFACPPLKPASASVPASAKNQQNEDDNDEKCRVVHVALLELEFVRPTHDSLAGKPSSLRAETLLMNCSLKRHSK